jgi:hypothetical protein
MGWYFLRLTGSEKDQLSRSSIGSSPAMASNTRIILFLLI